jgi:galactokinase
MITIFSPGRVNLIGEHTDYNDGFVMPAAIDRGLTLKAELNTTHTIKLNALDKGETFECACSEPLPRSGMGWTHYVLGVVEQMWKRGIPKTGFTLAFGGDLPIGAGMSSSAALTGGTAFMMNTLFQSAFSRAELALIAQAAEHEFVGIRSGIMDQFASLNGEQGHALLLDCRSLETQRLPFPSDTLHIILFDTTIRRELAASEYNARRAQCEQAVQVLQAWYPSITHLRDLTLEQIDEHKAHLDPLTYRRARYVIAENQRTTEAASALLEGDLSHFGKLMLASHQGLKQDYNVSCDELDRLVDIAQGLEGVVGTRMMGGGFGGCTINLVQKEAVEQVCALVQQKFIKQTTLTPMTHLARITRGTHLVEV